MIPQDLEILIEDLYEAIEDFEHVYYKSGVPLNPTTVGQELYDELSEAADFYFEGAGSVGDIIARGTLVTSRVGLMPCGDLPKVLRTVTEILRDYREVVE